MKRVFVLTGPTGVGKTDVAVALARRHGLELVSADSRQVYRRLDIGTAKPGLEVRADVTFHMIDIAEPGAALSAADFARQAFAVMHRLQAERRRFIVVGGAGFYLRALFRPLFPAPPAAAGLRAKLETEGSSALHERLRRLDPKRADELHPNDRQRVIRAIEVCELTGSTFGQLAESAGEPEFVPDYVVLNLPRADLFRRSDERFDRMMTRGLLDEVRALKAQGLGSAELGDAYGYAELLAYLDGRMTLPEAVSLAKQKTRAYARRQLTWFRSLSGARWVEFTDTAETAARLEPLLLETLTA